MFIDCCSVSINGLYLKDFIVSIALLCKCISLFLCLYNALCLKDFIVPIQWVVSEEFCLLIASLCTCISREYVILN